MSLLSTAKMYLRRTSFTEYLVGADGRLVARWATKVTPEDPQIVQAIEAALPKTPRAPGPEKPDPHPSQG